MKQLMLYIARWVGTQFAARDHTGDWSWHHPSGVPLFPAGPGGTLQSALERSHLDDKQSRCYAVQGVTVWGRSSAQHKLDIVILDLDVCEPYLLPGDNPYPMPEDVVAVIECKHYSKSVGLDIARNAGGLSADLGGAAVRVVPAVRWRQKHCAASTATLTGCNDASAVAGAATHTLGRDESAIVG